METKIILICVDPGLATGISVLEYEPGKSDIRILELQTLNLFFNLDRLIDKYRVKGSKVILLYESFHLVSLAANVQALEVIGVVKYLAHTKGLDIHHQVPSTKDVVDKRFSYLNLRKGKNVKHTESAMKHGIMFLAYKYKIGSVNLLWD